jgi:magnesium-transporting ATPase (P-type)
MGRIGKALGDIKSEKTILQKQVRKIVIAAFIIAVVLCLTIVVAYGIMNQNRIQGLLS